MIKMHRLAFLLFGLLTLGLFAGPAVLPAADFTWDGGGGNSNWWTANNWDPNIVPNASDANAMILDGSSVILNGSATVNRLELNPGTLTVNNNITLHLAGTAPTVVGGTIVLNGAVYNDSILNASGAVATLTGTVEGTHYLYSRLTGSGFTNQGTIHGAANIETHLTNTGTVTADPGKIMFFEGGYDIVNHNLIQASSGGTVRFQSSSVSGTGSLNPNGGTIAFNSATVTDHTLGDGNFVVEGTSTFKGTNNLASGTVVTVNNAVTLNLAASSPATVNGGTIVLNGAVYNDSLLNASGTVATLTGTLEGTHHYYSRLTGSGFINQGTIQGAANIETHLTNTGTVTADPGKTMFFEGGYNIINDSVIQGSFNGTDKGSVLFQGSLVSGTGTLNPNGGTISFHGATVTDHKLGDGNFVVSGTSTFKGTNTLAAGAVVTVNNAQTLHLAASSAAAVDGGTIVLKGAVYNDSLLNASGTVATLTGTVEGTHHYYSRLTGNGFINQGLIHGAANIETHLTNTGTVAADPGKIMFFEGVYNIINNNVIQADADGSVRFSSSYVSGAGTLNPNGGTISFHGATVTDHKLGDGSFVVEGTSTFKGTNNLAAGTVVTVNNAQTLHLTASSPALVNGGTIVLNGAVYNDSLLNASGTVATLTGTLEGTHHYYSRLTGSGFINQGLIHGAADFETHLTNTGTVAADPGKIMFFEGGYNIVNDNVIQADADGSVRFSSSYVSGAGSLNPNGGTIYFNGATVTDHKLGDGSFVVEGTSTFKGTNNLASGTVVTVNNGQTLNLTASSPALVNGGTIVLKGAVYNDSILNASGTVATLNGTVECKNGVFSRFIGTGFVNQGLIKGAGDFETAVTNHGEIRAEGGTFLVEAALTGTGTVKIADTGTLDMNHRDFSAGNFIMLGNGALTNNSGRTVALSQNFSFTQTDENKWNGGAGFKLTMNGGGPFQGLEVGGLDEGAVAAGFIKNFHLQDLTLSGLNTYAYLLDAFDNGNRTGSLGNGHEALYVDSLLVAAGTTLNLNFLHLYTKVGTAFHEVVAGEGYLFGGGNIINQVVPIPGALWLLGTGLAGLAGLRRFRKS